jgi:uncharacterized metal-binding protein
LDRKEYLKIHRQKLREKGICILCENKEAEQGFKSCSICRKKARKRLSNLAKNPDWKNHKNERVKRRREVQRQKAMRKIANGEPVCVACGCKDMRILEINHKKLNGKEDHDKQDRLIADILSNQRNLEDYDIRCKVCNIAHFLEHTYNVHWKIIWI